MDNAFNALYIPFWIYSNLLRSFCKCLCKYLYIPFWIYSNLRGSEQLEHYKTFTFHSGYIPITMSWTLLSVFTVFTFHSGYIPMSRNSQSSKVKLSLHSILDIFQWDILIHIESFEYFTFHSGYIPIYPASMFQPLFTIFTFHSGYIPILQTNRKVEICKTLHSILDIFQSRTRFWKWNYC